MTNDSPRQAKARKLREDRERCAEAAVKLRSRIRAGEYEGLPATSADDLLCFAAVLDSAAMTLSELPAQVRRDVLALVGRILDDAKEKPGDVPPLSAGPGV